jgi:PilZ domain
MANWFLNCKWAASLMTPAMPALTLGERRTCPRYPIKLAVSFLIRTGKFASDAGRGTSVNISSAGMLFRSSKKLTAGDTVTVALEWPPPPDGRPLMLLMHGHVVWIRDSHVGMRASHYGFLSQNIPAAADVEDLNRLALPQHLTPTKVLSKAPGVPRWRESVDHWK